jgi:hypothetical protein
MQLVDLPNRRVEAWKYSDLRGAVGDGVSAAPRLDRAAPEVSAALARGGVIGALAAQVGGVEELAIAPPGLGSIEAPTWVKCVWPPWGTVLRKAMAVQHRWPPRLRSIFQYS